MDRDDHLAEIVDELVAMPAFGVDTEFHREKTYFPQLALVQLSWGDRRALVDPLEVDLAPFARALEGPATVVMHAASQDLEVLHRACGVLPRDLFDTQLAAGFCGHSLPSLSSLVERYYDVHLPKGDRLTDWLRRPLNEDQRTYAAADVEYLLGLQEQLTAHLAERGRLEWALDECQALRARGQVVRDPDDAWLRIKEARSLRGETAAVARAVAAWRERRAAELDQPVRFVLSDLAVVGIAQRRPKAAADLARIRGVDERHAKEARRRGDPGCGGRRSEPGGAPAHGPRLRAGPQVPPGGGPGGRLGQPAGARPRDRDVARGHSAPTSRPCSPATPMPGSPRLAGRSGRRAHPAPGGGRGGAGLRRPGQPPPRGPRAPGRSGLLSPAGRPRAAAAHRGAGMARAAATLALRITSALGSVAREKGSSSPI
ncbi:MAG: HRDC domain-containing protein [Acidimicrobiales bacterium]